MILDFIDVHMDDINIVGGKGANLGELVNINLNVPSGFIVTTEAYKKFIEENSIDKYIDELVCSSREEHIKNLITKIRKRIQNGKLDEEIVELIKIKYKSLGDNVSVAVRSSATGEDLTDASFAGQQATFLNVQGIDAVLDAVIDCYASLWSNRAISYRRSQGYGKVTPYIAVVIQQMIPSETSGVLFTVNPLANKEEILINASYGLGESIVGGKVTADSYIVSRKGDLKKVQIGSKAKQIIYADNGTKEVSVSKDKQSKQVLNEDEIKELSRLGLLIEKHYKYPMDIEWAIYKNKIYILQARAITTLNVKNNPQGKAEDLVICKKLNKATRRTMSFLLEKMPTPYKMFDFTFINIITEQKIRILREAGITLSHIIEIDNMGIQNILNEKKHINRNIIYFLKIYYQLRNYEYCYTKCKEFMPRYKEYICQLAFIDYEQIPLYECKRILDLSYNFLQNLSYDRFKYAIFPSVLREKEFARIIKKIHPAYEAYDFYRYLDSKTNLFTRAIIKMSNDISKNKSLTIDIIENMSFNELYEKYNDFKILWDSFIEEFGYKSDYNCYCLGAKSFIEDPSRLLGIIKPILNMEDIPSNQEYQNYEDFLKKIKENYGLEYQQIKRKIEYYRYFHIVREESQYLWERLFYYVRKCIERVNYLLIGNKHYEYGVANLSFQELIEVISRGGLREKDEALIRNRIQNYPVAIKVWGLNKLLVFDNEGDSLKGISGSNGIAVGKVCLITNTDEFYKMKKGDILVCHYTDPEWTPLFKLASGVVADTGSSLSHAAIVAREFNIPAVLGVGSATQKFTDGENIVVDGNNGIVKRC